VLGMAGTGAAAAVTEPLDRAMLGRLATVVQRCTEAFEAYDAALALELTERFFWFFCDDYLELVKSRAYGSSAGGAAAAASAIAALRLALSVLLRLFAPFLPFVTDEVWSWLPQADDDAAASGSVHRASWPEPEPLLAAGGTDAKQAEAQLDAASAAIGAIRKAKSQARLPMRASVGRLMVTAPAPQLAALAEVLADVRAAGTVAEVELREAAAGEPVHDVTI